MVEGIAGRWRKNEASYGIWVNLPDLHLAETIARSGVDWMCFDLQHGLMDYGDLLRLMPAVAGTSITVFVRVSSNSAADIGRVLDAGADGVIVPMVNTAKDAADAVSACRYPPQGLRSCGPMRSAMLEGMSYLGTANERILCLAMIETQEGMSQVADIAATPGLDGLFVGPMDLCFGLGIAPGDFGNEKFTRAIADILSACKGNDIFAGMFGYAPELARSSVEQGFHFASIGSDISFFRAGIRGAVETATGKPALVNSAGY